jgi:hypothetical protein
MTTALSKAMKGLYGSFSAEEAYRHEPFAKALRYFQSHAPR